MKGSINSIIIFLVLTALVSCEAAVDKKVTNEIKKDQSKDEQVELRLNEETQNLLDGLNQAVLAGGDPDHRIEGLVSKGESNAMFTEFKDRLERAGYQVVWAEDKYELKQINSE